MTISHHQPTELPSNCPHQCGPTGPGLFWCTDSKDFYPDSGRDKELLGWGVVSQEQPALTLKSPALTTSCPRCRQCSRLPSPPEPLQLAGRILECAAPRQSPGAEHFNVVEYSLTLPIPLLYLVSKQGEKMLRKLVARSGSLAAKAQLQCRKVGYL